MIIAGTGRHAKDLLLVLKEKSRDFTFFDDISDIEFFESYSVLKTQNQVIEYFKKQNTFILGTGGTRKRKEIYDKLVSLGGKVESIYSKLALIGDVQTDLGNGLNVMPYVLISNFVKIGDGCLLNSRSSIHHDVVIGNYCELSPSCTILGGVSIGNFTSIGASTTVLPNITIGANCTIGAGSLITKDIPNNSTVYGVPGKVIS